MKILQIITTSGDGASQWLLNKGREMAKRGVQFDVLHLGLLDGWYSERIESWGGKVIWLPLKMQDDETVKTFFVRHGLLDYDFYHFQGMTPSFERLQPLLVAAGVTAPMVAHAHNVQGPYSKLFDYSKVEEEVDLSGFKSYSKWSAPVGCGREVIKSWYGQDLTENDMYVLPNSLDIDSFAKEKGERDFVKKQLRFYHGVPEDHQVVGYLGRVSPGKNIELILDLAEKSLLENDKLTYFIVGNGELIQPVERNVADRQLTNVRLILEWRDDVADLLSLFDIFLLPSLFEGVPNVIIEAQAVGTPSLVSNRVPDECDLGIGLVDVISIEEEDNLGLWRWAIAERLAHPIEVSREERIQAFIDKGYDNAGAADDYLRVVEQLIKKESEK